MLRSAWRSARTRAPSACKRWSGMNGNLDRFHRSKGSTEFGNLLTLGEVWLVDRLTMISGLNVYLRGVTPIADRPGLRKSWSAGADRSYRTAAPDSGWLTAAPSGRGFVRTFKF